MSDEQDNNIDWSKFHKKIYEIIDQHEYYNAEAIVNMLGFPRSAAGQLDEYIKNRFDSSMGFYRAYRNGEINESESEKDTAVKHGEKLNTPQDPTDACMEFHEDHGEHPFVKMRFKDLRAMIFDKLVRTTLGPTVHKELSERADNMTKNIYKGNY